jgi:hypothetical protein
MVQVEVIRATRYWKMLFRITDKGAIALWGRRIILDDYYWNDEAQIVHELGHIEDYEVLGTRRFLWKYLTLLLRHGYRKHPMETKHDEKR